MQIEKSTDVTKILTLPQYLLLSATAQMPKACAEQYNPGTSIQWLNKISNWCGRQTDTHADQLQPYMSVFFSEFCISVTSLVCKKQQNEKLTKDLKETYSNSFW